jgi:predicted transcriptional regulator
MTCYNRLKGEITMHIDLPQDLIERVQQHVAVLSGASEADVIRKALDSLDWQDGERQAIQEGIVAMNEGRVQDFEQFDREFRQEHGIASDA